MKEEEKEAGRPVQEVGFDWDLEAQLAILATFKKYPELSDDGWLVDY